MVFDGAAAIEVLLLVCCVSTLLPISQSVNAHRAKSTELLNFDVVLARCF